MQELSSSPGPVLKREGKKGLKIRIFGSVFLGFSKEIDPGTPLDRPGAPPDINLHQKSAPETNSKAISRGIWGVWILGRGVGVSEKSGLYVVEYGICVLGT